ncbi:plexin-B2-like isoform X2 [Mizuhopecten yessoensis]|nr:plexin-B2-like isoform X2 [Mizuhopecten yessoensis]
MTFQNASKCPQLSEMQIKLHKDKQTTVVIQAENLPSVNKTLYTCTVSNMPGIVSEVNSTEVICEVKVSMSGNVTVTYKGKNIDHNGTVASKVYTCENLATACSSCVYLNTQGYQCDWDLSTKKCSYNTTKMADSSKCPPPNISMISPRNGTISGRTSLTIHGTELGSIVTDINITVSGRQCEINKFSFNPPQWIQCYTGKIDTETEGGQVIVTRNSKQSTSNWTFKYLVPGLVSLDPIQGIKDGGRILTLKGSKLLTGNRHRMNVDLFNEEGKITCNLITSYTHVKNSSEIICSVGRYTGKQLPYRLTGVNVSYDDSSYVLTKQNVNFTFVDNPSIQIGRSQALRSGGVDMNITGERFRAVSVVKVDKVLCKVVSDNKVKCPVPAYNSSRSRRRRSSTTCPCGQVSTIHMDNYDYRFYMQFTENPTITPFTDIVSYKAGGFLTIEGEDLLRGAVESDYMVQVQSTNCHDVKVNANGTLITFKPPDFLSEGNEYQVEVLVGTSLRQHVGIIYYEKDLTTITIIAALGGTSLAMLVLIIICVIRSRRKDKQLNKLKTDIVEMESNIRNKSREVFADMQMSMQDIKGDLVTTGIPYFDYHNYSFHTLFPKLKAGESIYYQASATHQVEDFAKLAPRSILLFEELLKNKFFLQSLIGTLERQNKFSVQEKAEFSSLLTLTLMGKMTYISEVIEELLHRLIGRASRKQHRVLFRRSDSITQKLLSNWLALSLYPYLKGGGGQQLFMLYKASQTVMEKGPIDAVTLQAKDTLAEERLLKMDLQYESLTLEVDLNGRKELRYMCTVLDCDTITQVKAKCMYKIYKNKAASELHFTPDELVLEWHAGKGGKLVLNDIDRTSTKREGYVCRNTLKHYNVKDGSCMALLISDEPDDQELYYNTEATSMNDVLLSEHSMTSYMSMSPEKQWHMVFPEEDEKESRRQVLIEELYLNRLLHTKLTLMEYIDAVFENVLDEKRVPPVVCYLFKMFENIAKEHNVDPDIVSRWKSECYAMRIWSLWISCPDLLFDIILAKHVIPCLDVIKSMFSDVFSRTDSKLSKDSSSAKLLFANEVPKYQGEMRNFYDKVGSSCEPVTRQKFVSLMQEVSQQQTQEIKVKRLPALKKLFAMVKIFSDEIIADLDEEEETRDLKLGEKFDNVIQQMDTENV